MCSTNARKQGHTNIEHLDKTFFYIYEFTGHNKEFDITTAKNQCISEQAVVVQQKNLLCTTIITSFVLQHIMVKLL